MGRPTAGFFDASYSVIPRSASAWEIGMVFDIPLYRCVFFISGYLMDPITKEFHPWQYVKNRAKRLLVPYAVYGMVMTCISIAYEVMRGLVHRDVISIRQLCMPFVGLIYDRGRMLYGGGIDPIHDAMSGIGGAGITWFLTCMFVASVLVALYFKIQKTYILIIYVFFGYAMSFLPVLLPWSIDAAPFMALTQIAGYGYKRSKFENESKQRTFWLHGLAFAVYVAIIICNHGVNLSLRNYGPYKFASPILFLILTIFGSMIYVFLFKIIRFPYLIEKYLGYVGRNSITFLGLQMPTISILNIGLFLIDGNETFIDALAVTVMAAAGVTFMCRIKNKLINSMPALRYL